MPGSFWKRWYSTEEQDGAVGADQTPRRHQQQQQQQALPPWLSPAGGTGERAAPVGEAPPEGAIEALTGEEARVALDDSLAAHFATIQGLGDRAALEDLLPRLKEVLYQSTDIEPLKEQLRDPGASLSSESKAALWRQLAGLSFSRAVAACWLVPLLDLLVRAKLHLVGRHLYLESKLPALAPAAARGAPYWRLQMPPRLSDRAKEEFFRSDYFVEVGAVGLLHKIRRTVEGVLAGMDISAAVGVPQVEELLALMHASFESAFVRCEDAWAGYLVAPGQQPISIRTAAGVEAFMSPVEASMVDELNAELREVIADYRFAEALRSSVQATSRATSAYVHSKFFLPSTARRPRRSSSRQQPGSPAAAAGLRRVGGSCSSISEETSAAAAGGGAEESSSGGSSGNGVATAAAAVAMAAGGGGGQLGSPGPGQISPGVGNSDAGPPAAAEEEAAAVRPFPYVVPIIAKSCGVFFEETERCTRGISGLREVQALCASIFTFGPHIC